VVPVILICQSPHRIWPINFVHSHVLVEARGIQCTVWGSHSLARHDSSPRTSLCYGHEPHAIIAVLHAKSIPTGWHPDVFFGVGRGLRCIQASIIPMHVMAFRRVAPEAACHCCTWRTCRRTCWPRRMEPFWGYMRPRALWYSMHCKSTCGCKQQTLPTQPMCPLGHSIQGRSPDNRGHKQHREAAPSWFAGVSECG